MDVDEELMILPAESLIKQYELEQALALDMLDSVILYFCKVHLSDLLSHLKDLRNKTEKLSLRHELGLTEKKSQVIPKHVDYPCAICNKECIDVVNVAAAKYEDFCHTAH